ncbi:PIN domain-containing protein [Flagellimonas flava]|uniref:DUF4935 domain-containing protein n=1 Tax=Flagellimonas flava TaxID=570519 RepID=A0A1M5IL30_9FLAO|nr:PIN domain-containing protein [Allomuricauda flava]SHG28749.1 protein of unknown function [Allomuricauda flava]
MRRTIVFDTNILRSDFLLVSHNFRVFLDFCKKTNSTILIPTIVWEELSELYRQELKTRLDNLNKSRQSLNNLLTNPKQFEKETLDIESLVSDYISHLKLKFDHHLKTIEYRNIFLPELVKRSIQRIKPISTKGEEFRDAILWLSIIDYLKERNFEFEVSFITGNIKDFSNKDNTDLHPDLYHELEELRPTLKLYHSLSAFTKEIAVKIDFITKEWIIENIDWDRIQSGAERAVNGIDPAYFYEYYYRRNVDNNNLEYWDILWARFNTDIEEFHVFQRDGIENYGIEVHLLGDAEIEFENDKEQHFNREVGFGTIIYLFIASGSIVDCDDSFAVEETGLDFYN